MTSLSTHVLDAVTGNPVEGMTVTLTGSDSAQLASSRTNADGRITDLAEQADGLPPGTYRLIFDTGSYHAGAGFYPEVVITFAVTEDRHYHVPLNLSPFAYSTYRGS